MHRHTIPCFASSKSLFWLQLGSRETPHASHPETVVERCQRRNQRQAARAVWFRCEPSTLWRNPKTELACSSKRRTQSGMSARTALKLKPRRGNAFRASHQVSENWELFKKLEPHAQFQWEQIFTAVQPRRSLRGSKAESTTSSRYSSFRDHERSLDPGKLRRAAHRVTSSVSLWV